MSLLRLEMFLFVWYSGNMAPHTTPQLNILICGVFAEAKQMQHISLLWPMFIYCDSMWPMLFVAGFAFLLKGVRFFHQIYNRKKPKFLVRIVCPANCQNCQVQKMGEIFESMSRYGIIIYHSVTFIDISHMSVIVFDKHRLYSIIMFINSISSLTSLSHPDMLCDPTNIN